MTSLFAFQCVVGVLLVIPLLSGAVAVLGGAPIRRISETPDARLRAHDSDFRYQGGIWFCWGLVAIWFLFDVVGRASLGLAMMGMVFVGGIARLISFAQYGIPGPRIAVALFLELLVVPGLAYWLWQLAGGN